MSSSEQRKGNAMKTYEYASFWVWDEDEPGRDSFDRLKELNGQGWRVQGDFFRPEGMNNVGLWILRRPLAQERRRAA